VWGDGDLIHIPSPYQSAHSSDATEQWGDDVKLDDKEAKPPVVLNDEEKTAEPAPALQEIKQAALGLYLHPLVLRRRNMKAT
jgi:hypothetical protein